MRNDDVLTDIRKTFKRRYKTWNVLVIKSRINLIKQTERTRAHLIRSKQKRYGSHRFFTAGKKRNAFKLFSRRLSKNFYSACKDVLRIFQTKFRPSAAKQTPEHIMKILLDFIVCFKEHFGGLWLNFLTYADKVIKTFLRIVIIFFLTFIAVFYFGKFFHRHQVNLSQWTQDFARFSQFFAKFRRRNVNLVHTLFELKKVTRMLFLEILLYVAYLGVAWIKRKRKPFKLCLTFILLFLLFKKRIFLSRNVWIVLCNFWIKFLQIIGKLYAAMFNLRKFFLHLDNLSIHILGTFCFGE